MNTALLLTAVTLAFVHTILGPDHYLPFVMMSKAGQWSAKKTFWVTLFSGMGHVLSSVALGFVGLFFAVELGRLEALEGMRGSVAAWALLSFGFLYMVWGVKKAFSKETLHEPKKNMAAWVIFTIFLFGPCEPLIPLLMWPSAEGGLWFTALVALVFGVVTIATMLGAVMLSVYGFSFVRFKPLAKYTHALAGGAMCACGLAMVFLGL